MNIGEVIRENRKNKNMTQEEMAVRLGVTAPAVNKWENGNSMPDIMLLSPIARLLDITLDTLLSFKEQLTPEEINAFVLEADARLKNESYEDVFCWVKKTLELYPNCEQLISQMAVILDAQRMFRDIPDCEKYDDFIFDCYNRTLHSEDENMRRRGADMLFGFYERKEQYEKAEAVLAYFSEQDPERKRKQASLYSKTGRIQEAYQAYEELLFSGYQMISGVFHGIYMLALKENDMKKAHMIADKQMKLAAIFEMGQYHEASSKLELATMEQDVEATIEIMEKMLEGLSGITSFTTSALYEHMTFRETSEEFLKDLKDSILAGFSDEESYGFLKKDARYQKLMETR